MLHAMWSNDPLQSHITLGSAKSLTPDSEGRGKRVLSASNGQRPYICNPPGCIAQIEFYPQYSVTHFWASNKSRNWSPSSRPIDGRPLVSKWVHVLCWPDIDIRDISFKLCYITCISQSFSRIYVGFGLQSCVWWGEPVGLDKNACVRSILCGIIG